MGLQSNLSGSHYLQLSWALTGQKAEKIFQGYPPDWRELVVIKAKMTVSLVLNFILHSENKEQTASY